MSPEQIIIFCYFYMCNRIRIGLKTFSLGEVFRSPFLIPSNSAPQCIDAKEWDKIFKAINTNQLCVTAFNVTVNIENNRVVHAFT